MVHIRVVAMIVIEIRPLCQVVFTWAGVVWMSRPVPFPVFSVEPLVDVAESIVIVAREPEALIGIVFLGSIQACLADHVIRHKRSALVTSVLVLAHEE